MTREEAMNAEDERLDALVAEKIMGWQWRSYEWWDDSVKKVLCADGWTPRGDDFNRLGDDKNMLLFWDMPRYGIDMDAAFEAEEAAIAKCRERGDENAARYLDALAEVVGVEGERAANGNLLKLLRATAEQRCKASLLAILD